jgi:hypothetical protein
MSSPAPPGPSPMTVFAHVAGIPVEEALATLGPFAIVSGGWCLALLRSRLAKARHAMAGCGSRPAPRGRETSASAATSVPPSATASTPVPVATAAVAPAPTRPS